ncbi:ser/Thr protein phosphatase-like protein family [Aaosphaeria arxii CBS 175.79]|uniref:Ser/Thr protein phosphatase-like protein family n=1 Tax=Aaosphaeria arxii CBS 175.79 TaxID=1450172 RepID=A0A6A5Y2H3_9PLEO|nr:ser/Thr protein phosphatase-like protein family [Aaosphaeria arxii CBS 175.79]KAF2019648.1 ser/Thr protein phosphatase-like protein family [Aaosphaeria arxii CBS 175.79]
MAMAISISVLLSFAGTAFCAQPSAPSPIPAPLRELPWAQLNFLHTTDIHGWWGGHLQEPSYSADWGDYISFAKHLRDRADEDGSDLILVDTGDRIEGNAIYDSSKPRGKFTYEIAKEQNIDLICSGNHELYKKSSSEGEYWHTVPNFKGNYLASNLDIYSPETGNLEPLAPRFKKFTTKNQGIRILAFGFIFDFTGNANNTVVQKVEDTIKEDWFKEALKDEEVDLIVVFGHVDIRSPEYTDLYSAIRSAQWDTPIQFFGGHSHIRDYARYDRNSVALESGRYMETIGFMSIDGLRTGGTKDRPAAEQKSVKFSRLYLDNNLYSLRHHSKKDKDSFDTKHGLKVSAQINEARKSLNLDHRYGCAPQDYWVNRRPYPHNESIFTWLEEHVLPDTIKESRRVKDGAKAIIITNTGAVRFDLFKGPFTRDTKFLISPFTSDIKIIKDVPYEAASKVINLLNNEGPIANMIIGERTFIRPPEVEASWMRTYMLTDDPYTIALRALNEEQTVITDEDDSEPLIPGYTTQDDDGTDGDDTKHSKIPFYNVDNCIQAAVGFDPKAAVETLPEKVDLMYNEFIHKWILLALEYLGEKREDADAHDFDGGKSVTDIITDWVEKHWATEGDCP